MLDAYPHLMPKEYEMGKITKDVLPGQGREGLEATGRFLRETLARVKNSERLGMAARTRLLQRASSDLDRLASIEPTLAGFARFAELYIQCQVPLLSSP